MNNLMLFRSITGIPRKTLSFFLSITVHTYGYIEKGSMCLTPEIEILLARIYGIDKAQLVCPQNQITQETIETLTALSNESPEQQIKTISIRLSQGIFETLKPHQIRKIKASLDKRLNPQK